MGLRAGGRRVEGVRSQRDGRFGTDGRLPIDRKVRVVGQVNDIRVYSYTGTLGNELTGAFPGEGSSRACRSARAFVRLTLNTSFTA